MDKERAVFFSDLVTKIIYWKEIDGGWMSKRKVYGKVPSEFSLLRDREGSAVAA